MKRVQPAVNPHRYESDIDVARAANKGKYRESAKAGRATRRMRSADEISKAIFKTWLLKNCRL